MGYWVGGGEVDGVLDGRGAEMWVWVGRGNLGAFWGGRGKWMGGVRDGWDG